MHVERYGKGEKIIFLHGSGWNARMWYKQRDYLKTSMEVILVDLPGHGESPDHPCNSVEDYGNAIFETIEELRLDKCYVAGHSLGGAITMYLALAYPQVVTGVILISTGAKLKVLPQILEGILKDKEKAVRDIVELAFSQKASSILKDEDFYETMQCSSEVIFRDFNACDHFNLMDSVSRISIPALIICGTDDVLTPQKYSHYLNKEIKGSQLVLIEGAGHMVMWEKPEEVNRAIEKFIRSFP
jgi:pimeloyl-ACP methyl ester carboxylesterase